MIDDADWDKFLDNAHKDQTNAGLAHIAETLAALRELLIKNGFTAQQAFLLVRFYFEILMENFVSLEVDE